MPRLSSTPTTDATIYRFTKGRLHWAPNDRAEYESGAVVEQSVGRWTVGNKTIVLDGGQYASATVSHTEAVEVRILQLSCRYSVARGGRAVV